MTPDTHIPGAAGHQVPRNIRLPRRVLALGLLPAGLALGAHGLLAGAAAAAVAGAFALLLAGLLMRLSARHDPATIRAMERRNEETFATW